MNAPSTRRPVVVGVLDKQPDLLDYANGLATMLDRPLRVVNAFEFPATTADVYVSQEVIDSFEAAAHQVIADARSHLEAAGSQAPTDYVVAFGSPAAVLDLQSETAELVVIGTDDVGWLRRLGGAAVSAYVVQHAHSPVVVVPPGIARFDLDEVVLTLDGETSAHGPLTFAFQLADRAHAVLRVVHVVPVLTSDTQLDASLANVAELVAGWSEDYPDVQVVSTLTYGEPVDEGVHASGPNSIVVVGRPHTQHMAITLGRPVATAILRHAGCPVAVVPADYGNR
jgi:nucleotide-binding universal stress UspA family protein